MQYSNMHLSESEGHVFSVFSQYIYILYICITTENDENARD